MGQPSSKDEMTIRHQFDRLCQMALKGEAVNYYKHMDYRRKHEVTFSELSEKELSKLFTMDEYGTEYHHFEVHGYDIEVKNTLIAEALKELTERKRNVILLSYFMEMSDADIAREMNLVRSTIHEHRTRSLEILKKSDILEKTMYQLTLRIEDVLQRRSSGKIVIGAIVFSNEYGILGKTPAADKLLELIKSS